jgi:hypothetical protein
VELGASRIDGVNLWLKEGVMVSWFAAVVYLFSPFSLSLGSGVIFYVGCFLCIG